MVLFTSWGCYLWIFLIQFTADTDELNGRFKGHRIFSLVCCAIKCHTYKYIYVYTVHVLTKLLLKNKGKQAPWHLLIIIFCDASASLLLGESNCVTQLTMAELKRFCSFQMFWCTVSGTESINACVYFTCSKWSCWNDHVKIYNSSLLGCLIKKKEGKEKKMHCPTRDWGIFYFCIC